MSEERTPNAAEAGERIEAVKALLDAHRTMSIAANDGEAPWIAKVFFVDDEVESGRLDLCVALLDSSRTSAMIEANPRLAFLVASDTPDRWIQGVGEAEFVADDSDAAAIAKALASKSPDAEPFLARIQWRALRIHVRRLKVTDVALRPPVAELSFS